MADVEAAVAAACAAGAAGHPVVALACGAAADLQVPDHRVADRPLAVCHRVAGREADHPVVVSVRPDAAVALRPHVTVVAGEPHHGLACGRARSARAADPAADHQGHQDRHRGRRDVVPVACAAVVALARKDSCRERHRDAAPVRQDRRPDQVGHPDPQAARHGVAVVRPERHVVRVAPPVPYRAWSAPRPGRCRARAARRPAQTHGKAGNSGPCPTTGACSARRPGRPRREWPDVLARQAQARRARRRRHPRVCVAETSGRSRWPPWRPW